MLSGGRCALKWLVVLIHSVFIELVYKFNWNVAGTIEVCFVQNGTVKARSFNVGIEKIRPGQICF